MDRKITVLALLAILPFALGEYGSPEERDARMKIVTSAWGECLKSNPDIPGEEVIAFFRQEVFTPDVTGHENIPIFLNCFYKELGAYDGTTWDHAVIESFAPPHKKDIIDKCIEEAENEADLPPEHKCWRVQVCALMNGIKDKKPE